MTDPTIIDTDAREAMDEAPPERTTVETTAAVEIAHPQRPQHVGARTIAGTALAVVPNDHELATLAQMAVTIAGAKTAPRALQGNPNDAFLVMLTARDVGVGLTTAVREFHVIDGKVTLSPKVKLAMVHQQGVGDVYPHQGPRQVLQPDGTYATRLCPCGLDDPPNNDQRATWHAERKDQPGILHGSTFTLEMAARVSAKEGGRTITLAEKSTWKQYPQRMLSWRALGYLLDDVFPEVGTGLYSPDEMGAVTDEDGVPLIDVVGQADPVRGTAAPRGHNQPPPPPASDEDRDEIRGRIDALAAHDTEARAALLGLWTTEREDGSPALPPLNRLLASQVSKARAMVASIETRAKAGEWGPWAAESPGDASEDDPGTDGADDAPEAGSDDQGVDSGDDERVALITAEVIEEVKALDGGGVDPQLILRSLPTSGRLDTRRHRLATAMVAERLAGETPPAEA